MNRRQLKTLVKEIVQIVNEQISPKFWWLDPSGTLHQVPAYGHWDWALIYLTQKEHFDKEEVEKNVYGNMLKLGWARVALFEYNGRKALEYDVSKRRPLTPRQLKELKDIAIEEGAEEIIPHPYDPA